MFFAERRTDLSHLEVFTTIADLTTNPGYVIDEDSRLVSTITDATPPGEPITFFVPPNPQAISFTYQDLLFDTDDPKSINDAFELALVDEQGRALVPTIGLGKDSFFNFTEGETAKLAAGATLNGNTITLDISHVTPGIRAARHATGQQRWRWKRH